MNIERGRLKQLKGIGLDKIHIFTKKRQKQDLTMNIERGISKGLV